MARIELIIIDGDGWWCFGTLYQDVGLFQGDGQPEVSQAWEKRSISVCSSR